MWACARHGVCLEFSDCVHVEERLCAQHVVLFEDVPSGDDDAALDDVPTSFKYVSYIKPVYNSIGTKAGIGKRDGTARI